MGGWKKRAGPKPPRASQKAGGLPHPPKVPVAELGWRRRPSLAHPSHVSWPKLGTPLTAIWGSWDSHGMDRRLGRPEPTVRS